MTYIFLDLFHYLLAVNKHRALVVMNETCQYLHQSSLATAVRTEQTNDFSLADFKADIGKRFGAGTLIPK